MITGYVKNNSGRHKHIFKRNVSPDMKVAIEDLYATYKAQYKGDFDEYFLEWFKEHKLPASGDFELVVEEIKTAREEAVKDDPNSKWAKINSKDPAKLTATEISELRIKDNPRAKLQHITSVYKLRRALTRCYRMKGKEMLANMIKARIKELMADE